MGAGVTGETGPPPRRFDIARTGTVDMAYQFNGFLRRRVPLVQLSLVGLALIVAVPDIALFLPQLMH